jgi:hypothetical protein
MNSCRHRSMGVMSTCGQCEISKQLDGSHVGNGFSRAALRGRSSLQVLQERPQLSEQRKLGGNRTGLLVSRGGVRLAARDEDVIRV